ncbi:MAG: hypothetical protein PPP55_07245 [Halorubrum sp.]
MLRSSDDGFAATDRAAVEPTAALVAVFAVGIALGLYVGVLDDVTASSGGPGDADALLESTERELTVGGVVRPDRLEEVRTDRVPATIELRTASGTWRVASETAGVTGPTRADTRSDAVAERRVTVRVGPGTNAPGTLRVVVR